MHKKPQNNPSSTRTTAAGHEIKQMVAADATDLPVIKPPIRFIRIGEVVARTNRGRSTIYDMVQLGEFPAPVKLGARAVAWIESEVEHWIQSRTFHRASIRRSKVYPGEISASPESSENPRSDNEAGDD